VLLRAGAERGRELLDEATRVMASCADPGITLPLLGRVAAAHRIAAPRPAPALDLVEQLSERELAVLRYLPSTLSLPEIARELYVSPNTVKTQCSAIYRKLGVTGRKAAVQAARERRLL
jgi:LuxR family maltose regulon positive regulatory protein